MFTFNFNEQMYTKYPIIDNIKLVCLFFVQTKGLISIISNGYQLREQNFRVHPIDVLKSRRRVKATKLNVLRGAPMSEWKVFYDSAEVNPAGTEGFEFLEFSSPTPQVLQDLFSQLGFVNVATHKSKAVELWQQGTTKFIINAEPNSFAALFAKNHGPSVCGMAFRVKNAAVAYQHCLAQGAKAFTTGENDWCPTEVPVISGIGDNMLYLVDRDDFYQRDFNFDQAALQQVNNDVGITYLDHVTHNLFVGNMDQWATFYGRLFNFTQIRYFDIQGEHTGLISRALRSPCRNICIPLNEPKDEMSQIKEFTDEYKGEGIQHIALATDDIYKTVETLRARGQGFLDTPNTYYRMIEDRLPGHNEDLTRMQKNKILVDGEGGETGKRLLQIFTETEIGPVFFEIIQRKGDEGFGEGNFQALFDSIELEQIERGYLKVGEQQN